MRAASAARLLVPAAALTALLAVPLTSPGKAPVLGIQQAPLAASITPIATPPATTMTDRLVGINDVHGYIQAGTAGSLYGTPAGGIRQLTNQVEQLENAATTTGGKPNVSVVGAGDMVGASPLISALFDDEPTIDAIKGLNLDYTSVGNHEFDRGQAELKRQQDGGCGLTAASSSASQASQQCTFAYGDDYQGGSSQPPAASRGSVAPTRPTRRRSPMTTRASPPATSPPTSFPTRWCQRRRPDRDRGQLRPTSYQAPIFPAYGVKTFPNGSKVGYIGEVLAGTPGIVTAAGVKGLAFLDEATSANYYAQKLQAQGVNTIVLLIHQGGAQSSVQGQAAPSVDSCSGFTGDLQPILANLSSAISVVVSAHTHQAYDCSIPEPSGNKLVTSAAKYSQAVTSIDLTVTPFDGTTGGDQLVSAAAKNVTVNTSALTYEGTTAAAADQCPANTNATGAPTSVPTANANNDPLYFHEANIECAAKTESATKANAVEGNITADIKRATQGPTGAFDGFGETQMGDVIADAQLADSQAVNPAVSAAFMNEGGVRNDLLFAPANNPVNNGQVTYGENFQVQPFGDYLVTEQLTGAQILTVLQQQFKTCNPAQYNDEYLPLAGMTYTVNFGATSCATLIQNARIGVPVGSDSTTAGQPLNPNTVYTIEDNNYLAGGGDSFPGFTAGTNMTYGDVDVDALNNYLAAHNTSVPGETALVPPTPDRVSVANGSPATFNPAPAAALPETPLAISLPIIAVLLGGGSLALRRRRRNSAGTSGTDVATAE